MGDQNQNVTLTFTINLAPYADGLKTMLGMTQAAGAQVQPLLNFKVDKVDFSGIEKALGSYNARIKDVVTNQNDAAASSAALGSANDTEAPKVTRTRKAHEEKALSLNKVKREALETFGAIAFLTQSLVGLAASNDPANKNIEKLNQGLNQGISAGFGLAGILGTLGVASGGTAVAIGGIVTVAVALLKVYDDVEDVTARNEKIQNEFAASMRGTAVSAWDLYITQLKIGNEEARKSLQVEQLRHKVFGESIPLWGSAAKAIHNVLYNTKDLTAAEEQYTQQQATLKTALNERKNLTKSIAETQTLTEQSQLESIVNLNKRATEEEKLRYKNEVEMIKASDARGKIRKDALTAADTKHQAKLREIDEKAKNDSDQLSDARFESELNKLREFGIKNNIQTEKIDLELITARIARYKKQLSELEKLSGPLTQAHIAKQVQLQGQLTSAEADAADKQKAIRERVKTTLEQLSDARFESELNKLREFGTKNNIQTEKIDLEIISARIARYKKMLSEFETLTGPLTEEQNAKQVKLQGALSAAEAEGGAARKAIRERDNATREQLAESGLQKELLLTRKIGLEKNKSEEQISLEITNQKKKAATDQLQILEDQKNTSEISDNDYKIKKGKLENDISQLTIDASEQRKQIIKHEAEAQIQAIANIFGNLAQAAQQLYQLKQQGTNKELQAEEQKRKKELQRDNDSKKRNLDREKSLRLETATTAEQRDAINQEFYNKQQALDENAAASQEALHKQMNERALEANKTAFAMQKAFSIAQAIIQTYSSATAALAPPPLGVGPIFGPILAGAVIALGLANVAAIAAQEPQGLARGGTVGGIGGPEQDNIIIRASVGEEVINSKSANNNRELLKLINIHGRDKAIPFTDVQPGVKNNSPQKEQTSTNHGLLKLIKEISFMDVQPGVKSNALQKEQQTTGAERHGTRGTQNNGLLNLIKTISFMDVQPGLKSNFLQREQTSINNGLLKLVNNYGRSAISFMDAQPSIKSNYLQNDQFSMNRQLAGGSNGGGGNVTHYHTQATIKVERFIGTREFFEEYIKPSIQEAVRDAGKEDASTLFPNPKKQKVTA